jgi:hypothetical protein
MNESELKATLESLPEDPLREPGTIRLLLSAGASQALTDSGHECFQIVGKTSYPALPGRWAIYLRPVPLKIAQDACNVILGTHRAAKIKIPPAATPATKEEHCTP